MRRRTKFHLLLIIAIAGAGAAFFKWKRDSDRDACILNIRQVQQAMRSYMGMNAHNPETDVPGFSKDTIIGEGKPIASVPVCPAGGTYTWIEGRQPAIGVLSLRCSCPDHVPPSYSDW